MFKIRSWRQKQRIQAVLLSVVLLLVITLMISCSYEGNTVETDEGANENRGNEDQDTPETREKRSITRLLA